LKRKTILMTTKQFSVKRLSTLSTALFLVIMMAFLSPSLRLTTVAMSRASNDESMKQPLGTRPNYDAPADWPWGETLPQGVNITDYNLTDPWGGKWCDAEKTDDDKDDDEIKRQRR